MNKSKLSAILSLVFVFASGVVLGGFAYRLYFVTPMNAYAPGGVAPVLSPAQKKEEFKRKYVTTLTKEAKLDPDQVLKLNDILAKTDEEWQKVSESHKAERDEINAQRDEFRKKLHPEFEAIHNHQVDMINSILRDDQKALYANFRAKRDRERKIMRDQQKKQ
jgi:hypothetical protein